MALGCSEARTLWTEFLRSLARGGLNGVQLVISEDQTKGVLHAACHTGKRGLNQRAVAAGRRPVAVQASEADGGHGRGRGRCGGLHALPAGAPESRPHRAGPLERLDGEVKRRTDVVGIFPNEAAAGRLVGAILADQNDEWALQRAKYMTLDTQSANSDNEFLKLPSVEA